jgi:predicted acyltransferase
LLLLAIGMFLDSAIARTPTFGLGVLQLIGLAYLVGALLIRLPLTVRLGIAAVLLLVHWALLKFVAAPGVPAGTFEENANVIHYLNMTYLAPLGLKGVISVITTGAMVLIGSAIGNILQRQEMPASRRAALTAGAGVILTLLGWAWSLDLPMNKPLWTSPYILFCAGLGAIVLATFYVLIDMFGQKWLAFPFIVAGANAIIAYTVPILIKVMVLQVWVWPGTKDTLFQSILTAYYDEWGRVKGGWLYTLTYMAVFWLMLLYLYRRKLFLRV